MPLIELDVGHSELHWPREFRERPDRQGHKLFGLGLRLVGHRPDHPVGDLRPVGPAEDGGNRSRQVRCVTMAELAAEYVPVLLPRRTKRHLRA